MRRALCLVIAALGCGRARTHATGNHAVGAAPLVARKGAFERRFLLTGEIDAVSSAELRVPRIPMGRVTVRWLADDGAVVKKGDKVAELDNANFVAKIRDGALSLIQAETELKRQQWQNELDDSDKALDVERKRSALARAQIDADVPDGILPKRDFLEKQMVVRRARADLEKAEDTLTSGRRTADLDLSLKKIALEKNKRELDLAQQMIDALTLRAPADGAIVTGDHWEGRKLQIADEIPVGFTVVRFPDLHQIRVKAWLSDVDDGRVAPDMPAEIVLDAYPDQVLKGKILDIAAVAREVTDKSLRRVFQVSVAIDGPADAQPRPGMSARVEVIADRRAEAVLVPRAALDDRTTVTVADGRTVAVGPCNAEVCVATGIDEGARLRRTP